MENYFQFWKHLPKFILGLIFMLLLIIIIFGINNILNFIKNTNYESINGIFQSVLLIFIILIFSSIGLKIQDLLMLILKYIFKVFLKIMLFKKIIEKLRLMDLMKPAGQIAMDILDQNKKFLLKYYYLKSYSQPEAFGKFKNLSKYYEEISLHLSDISNYQLIEQLDYNNSLTQEQAKRDDMKNEITELFYIIINSFLFFVCLMLKYNSFFSIALFIAIMIIELIIIIPQIIELKQKLGSLIIMGYLESFTIGEGADMADRAVPD